MPPYEHHVFVCTHHRPDGSHTACTREGESAFLNRLKELVKEADLRSSIRINKAGCLGRCRSRSVVVVYPEAVWYGGVTAEDAEEIFREHLLGGRPVERLLIPQEALASPSHAHKKSNPA